MQEVTFTLEATGNGLFKSVNAQPAVYISHDEIANLFDVPVTAERVHLTFSRVVDAYDAEPDSRHWAYVRIGYPFYAECPGLLIDNDVARVTEVATGYMSVAMWLMEQGYTPFTSFAMRVSYEGGKR